MSNFCQQGDITKIFIVDTGSTGSTGNDIYVTGGTYSNGTLTLGRNDGVSILISGFLTGATGVDIYVTGGTYSNGNLILGRNDGINISISGFSTTAIFTGNTSANCISDLYISNLHGCSPITVWDPINSLSSISATTYYGDGSNLTGISDYYVTGGTYSNGSLILDRQNGSVTITGFLTGTTTDTFVTGFTYNGNNQLTISQNQGQSPLSVTINNLTLTGLTVNGSLSASTYLGLPVSSDNFVTGGTFSNNTLTLNRQNGSVTVTGFTDYFVTGGTYSNGTLTLNRQNGSVTVTGFLTGTTTDTFVTGFTFSSNTLTISQNQGQAPLTANITTIDLSNIFSAVTFNIGTTGSISASTFYGSGANLTGVPDNFVTGGTYSNGTLTLNRQNGSVSVSGFLTGTTTDNFVTGGTYSNGILTLNRQNGSVTISGLLSADTYVTGFTFNTGTYDLTIFQNNGILPLTQNLGILAGDITVTGGTYNPNNGVATFYNNAGAHSQGFRTIASGIYSFASGSGSTASGTASFVHSSNSTVSGNRSVVLGGSDINGTANDYVYVSNLNIDSTPTNNDSNTQILSRNSSTGNIEFTNLYSLTGYVDTFITGFTYNNANRLTISRNQGLSDLSVNINRLTGLTVTNGLSADTLTLTQMTVTASTSTQALVRNTTTGVVESRTFGLENIVMSMNPPAIPIAGVGPNVDTIKGIPQGQVITGYTAIYVNNVSQSGPTVVTNFGTYDNTTGLFTTNVSATLMLNAWIHLKPDTSTSTAWSLSGTGEFGLGICPNNATDIYVGDYQVVIPDPNTAQYVYELYGANAPRTNQIDISTSTVIYAGSGSTFRVKALNKTDRNYDGSAVVTGDGIRFSITRIM